MRIDRLVDSRIVDVSHTLTASMPFIPHFAAPSFGIISHADGRGTTTVSEFAVWTPHGHTHRRPMHFIPGGKSLQDFEIDRFILEAVVWDVSKRRPCPVTSKDLASARPACRPGDTVLLCTGGSTTWDRTSTSNILTSPPMQRSGSWTRDCTARCRPFDSGYAGRCEAGEL
jgi:kynurenine formamidase